MFTGLVMGLGNYLGASRRGAGYELRIAAGIDTGELAIGDSIAVNGICLTVTELGSSGIFKAMAGRETVEKTTLASWRKGRRLNLELALRLQDRLGGHLVQGHVDGVTRVLSVEHQEETRVLWLALPGSLSRYVVQKGSVAVDGVSLTVNAILGKRIKFNVIPHTWESTSLADLRPGDRVNLEVDVLARYVERLLGLTTPDAHSRADLVLEKLRENGFL